MTSSANREACLVTGGAGYIGSHVVRQLRETGRRPTVLDDLSTCHREARIGGEELIVGDGRGSSVRDVAAAVKRVSGRQFRIEETARRPCDPASPVADAGLIRAKLGWKPRFDSLERIVDDAWRWEYKRSGKG